MITTTLNAINAIKSQLTKRGKGLGIRLLVKTTGCSGFAYNLEFCDTVEPDDIVYDTDGVKIVTDPKSLVYLNGTEIDYSTSKLEAGFKFNNPNVQAMCGCGESFSV